nr:Dihydrofolate reductase [uncultured bacterium]
MILSAIVAASDNDVIGNQGKVPWFIKGEQQRVKEITWGQPLIMGRKTHESIGRTLPGRLNVVISRDPQYKPYTGAIAVSSINSALDLPEVKAANEAFIFGGEKIYELAMPQLDKIYLTRVHADLPGDSFFKFDPTDWKVISQENYRKDPQLERPYDFDYLVLERK